MRGLGDTGVLITIRRYSDSEMGGQGFLDLPYFYVPAMVTMGSMTTDSSLRRGPYILAGVSQETHAEVMT